MRAWTRFYGRPAPPVYAAPEAGGPIAIASPVAGATSTMRSSASSASTMISLAAGHWPWVPSVLEIICAELSRLPAIDGRSHAFATTPLLLASVGGASSPEPRTSITEVNTASAATLAAAVGTACDDYATAYDDWLTARNHLDDAVADRATTAAKLVQADAQILAALATFVGEPGPSTVCSSHDSSCREPRRLRGLSRGGTAKQPQARMA